VVRIDDTTRLDFLLEDIVIDDVGDEFSVPGIVIRHEGLSERLDYGIISWNDDIRDVIDAALEKVR